MLPIVGGSAVFLGKDETCDSKTRSQNQNVLIIGLSASPAPAFSACKRETSFIILRPKRARNCAEWMLRGAEPAKFEHRNVKWKHDQRNCTKKVRKRKLAAMCSRQALGKHCRLQVAVAESVGLIVCWVSASDDANLCGGFKFSRRP